MSEPVDTRCKVGKVTFKASNLTMFPKKQQRTQVHDMFIEDAAFLNDYVKDMDGYVIVGWNEGMRPSGRFMVGSKLPREVIPEYIKHLLTAAIIEGEIFGGI